jgi:Nuclease-related domain
VNDEDTRASIGYYDCKAGRLMAAKGQEHRTYEALAALRPFLGGSVPEALRSEIGDSPLAQEADLARNPAGQAVAARAAQLRPKGWQGLAARVLGLRTEATSWQIGAKGEQVVGKRLDRLKREGWQVLASVVKRSGADIDHLVIGPPGVFTVNTKLHRDARIWVGEHVLKVDGTPQQYLRNSRHEAAGAARVLSSAVGMTLSVTPVLAFVGAASIDLHGSRGDVLVVQGEEVDRVLRDLPAVYSVQERERIFAVARRAEIWLA